MWPKNEGNGKDMTYSNNNNKVKFENLRVSRP